MHKLVLTAICHGAEAHGRITWPPSRQGGSLEVAGNVCGYHDGGTGIEDGCAWVTDRVQISGLPTLVDPVLMTMRDSIANPTDTLNPGTGPWRAPGTVPVTSPCGKDLYRPEMDGRDLPVNPSPVVWQRGSTAQVATALYINHGGGWSFRLCPKDQDPSEDCFQQHALQLVGQSTLHFTNGTELSLSAKRTADSTWSRNLIPGKIGQHLRSEVGASEDRLEYPMPFSGLTPNQWDFSIVENVALPNDLPLGDYLLSWRWDCESSPQVWFSCADVSIVDVQQLVA